ncbi:MAG: hypothetical protein CM15mP115_18110 [Alphaproteobacteria bacterium]|nr:MAG: hypothetical protein CM15mP115_18110 [Alphaproteobacteria bacterium]
MKLEFHHINYVSKDVDALHKFYVDILKMDDIAPQNFPRPTRPTRPVMRKIKFATEGSMQMHLAERGFDVAARNGRHINPVERGHIAFRTDDMRLSGDLTPRNRICRLRHRLAAKWHQIFFYDPKENHRGAPAGG